VGLYLFLNLLFAVLFSNYKIVNEQATQKHKENVDKYFQGLFTDFDWENNGFIDTDSLTDALGGKSIIQADPRIEKILDQTRVINDSMISAEDLKFILTYTATQKLQKTYITRL
jgi:Ca2+-binding EF-hand superfamily protein